MKKTFKKTRMPDEVPGLGPCRSCGGTLRVRNVAMLDQKAPIPETGWGCFQCGLPQNGALAVLCDDCIENIAPILRAYLGDPASQERIEIERLSGPHRCDLAKHPEAKAEGRVS